MVGLIIGIVLFVACILAGIITAIDEDFRSASPWIVISGIVVGGLSILFGCFSSVPTGYTGIVTTFGRVENITLDAGFHMKSPWNSVINMDNRVQKKTVNLEGFSSDIQEVKVVYTVNYQIRKADAMTIYSTVGRDYYDVVVEPAISEAVKVATAKYTAESLISSRTELAESIENILSDSLDRYNIIVVSTAIEDMDFSDAFTNAVEAKQVAAQNKLQAQIEQEQKTMEAQQAAERSKIDAQAQAEVVKIQAQADMEVAKIGADSAEYQGQKEGAIALQRLAAINGWTVVSSDNGVNKLIKADGSDVSDAELEIGSKKLIQYYYIMQWNGILPETMLGDTADIILGI